MKCIMRIVRLIPIALLLIAAFNCLLTNAGAQEPPSPPFAFPGEGPIPEGARERVELLLKWKIIEVLDLDENQATKIFPLYSKLRQSRRDYMIDRMTIVQELKQALESEVDKSTIEKMLDKLDEFDRSFVKSREETLGTMRKNLTLEQWARYVIFESEFPREIRKMMRERLPFPKNSRRRRW